MDDGLVISNDGEKVSVYCSGRDRLYLSGNGTF